MKAKIISCWFNTSYAVYTNGLRRALERQLGEEVGVIASNCGCNDPMDGVFFDRSCDYFEMPHIHYWRSTNPVKRWFRLQGRQMLYRERAKKYLKHAGDATVLHFQQTLNAYGSLVVFNWLKAASSAARVVTVHELDEYQQDYPQANLAYNLANRIIVHASELKESMISLGVDRDRIDVVEHGVEIPPVSNDPREGIIFYGGHKLNSGKGLDTLCKAMALVKKRMGADTPALKIYGYYGEGTIDYGRRCASEAGVSDLVRWLNRIDDATAIKEYQRTLLCVLPFVGSFAGFPAVNAMANGVPVIGTRFAGLPEHVGDAGVLVEANDPEVLATTIVNLLSDNELRASIAAKGRARAEALLSWDAIAKKTIRSYERAIDAKNSVTN